LAPDDIPEEILTGGDASILGENLGAMATNKLSFARTIGEAGRFSLLDRDTANHALKIHRLVQIVVKAEMSTEERKIWGERAVLATGKAFPELSTRTGDCARD
jgi:hypothetical protein